MSDKKGRNMSQHLSFTLLTKDPEDFKTMVDFAVESTKVVFQKHGIDYTEYLTVEKDYLDWYDCFSGLIDFDSLLSGIASEFPQVEFVLCLFPSSDPGWIEFEWKDGRWVRIWSNSESCLDGDADEYADVDADVDAAADPDVAAADPDVAAADPDVAVAADAAADPDVAAAVDVVAYPDVAAADADLVNSTDGSFWMRRVRP